MSETEKKKPGHEPGTVSAPQLAAALDCTTRTIEKYAEQNIVVKVARGRYHFLQSIKNVVAHLRKQAASQVSNDGKLDQVQENVRFKAAQRKMAEMRIEQMEGTLISVAEVEEAWSALVTANRQLVLSIPGRCRMELPDLTGHEQTIIQDICRQVLTETALGEGNMPRAEGPKGKRSRT